MATPARRAELAQAIERASNRSWLASGQSKNRSPSIQHDGIEFAVADVSYAFTNACAVAGALDAGKN